MNLFDLGYLPNTFLGWVYFMLSACLGPLPTLIYMRLDIVGRVREFKFGEKRIPKTGELYE